MKINLAKSAGFCFGVKRALEIALKTAQASNEVYMLGDIVHNEQVVKEIERSGIKKIKKLSKGKGKILLIRAHGACQYILKKAADLGYTIVDATCPMVKEIHKIAKDCERKGYKIIVIGDKKHDEVHGIIGQLNQKAIVIDNRKNIPLEKVKRIKKACMVLQSTQNLEKALKIFDILKLHIPEIRFFNTICRPTRIKQDEIKKMPLENDVMIIIGSQTSANTKRLYEISKSLNKKSYWVNSKKEINPDWFKGAQKVGITAGASTPESSIKDILKFISILR
jgi:4-hydroxy-3-methylbut-2-enyl diphosphate reductase